MQKSGALTLRLGPKIPTISRHPGIASVLRVIIHDSDNHNGANLSRGTGGSTVSSEGSKLVVLQSYYKHSILSVSRFHANTLLSSSTIGNIAGDGVKDLRLRFIVYQVLQALCFLSSRNLCVGDLTPSSIMLDDNMWVYLQPSLGDKAMDVNCFNYLETLDGEAAQKKAKALKADVLNGMRSTVDRPIDYKEPMTIQWVKGKISNFEYLMAINTGAGRSMSDALYHPLMPWVTDFSVPFGGWRDFSMTKFRLSKGDAQLETTFKHSEPPHHVPESLSELTYYIYLARRTPMQVLRRVVRDVFVPEHYPQSISRIYVWTPDECIPEFFVDSTVFGSIHKEFGLQDLDLPNFASSPSEFIRYHRAVLESEEVSKQLHMWIDLTFGYCLNGLAAIQNMNVPLRHTISTTDPVVGYTPNANKNPGFIMLFSKPHPKRSLERQDKTHIFQYEKFSNRIRNQDVSKVSSKASHDESANVISTNSNLDRSSLSPDVDLSQDFPKYSFNNSSKYANISIGDNLSSIGSNGLEDLLSLDKLIAMDESLQPANIAKEEPSVNSAANNTTSNSAYNILKNSGKFSLGDASADDKQSTNTRRSVVRNRARTYTNNNYEDKLRLAGAIQLDGDLRCYHHLNQLLIQRDEYQFSDSYDSFITGTYALNSTVDCNLKSLRVEDVDDNWDKEFLVDLATVYNSFPSTNQFSNPFDNTSEDLNDIIHADDCFALGCIIAELYLGQPLLSENDAMRCSRDYERTINHLSRVTTDLPLSIRRLILLLLQNKAAARPKASEILLSCELSDEDSWTTSDLSKQKSGGSGLGFIDFDHEEENTNSVPDGIETNRSAQQTPPKAINAGEPTKHGQHALVETLSSPKGAASTDKQLCIASIDRTHSARLELLSDYCSGIFPSYFCTVYELIGRIKLCTDGLHRIKILADNLDVLMNLPIEGISISLCHILEIIRDPLPFRDAVNAVPTNQDAEGKNAALYRWEDAVRGYPKIIDVIGSRLGVDGSARLLVPKILEYLNNLGSPTLLIGLLQSKLWNILILRTGIISFLKYFLPLLLTYASAGTLQNVSRTLENEAVELSPMWKSKENTEQTDWLHLCPLEDIRQVQITVLSLLTRLVDPEALGIGIFARYVIPPLISLVGVPQLAAAGFSLHIHKLDNKHVYDEVNKSFFDFCTKVDEANTNIESGNDEYTVLEAGSERQTLVDIDRPQLSDINNDRGIIAAAVGNGNSSVISDNSGKRSVASLSHLMDTLDDSALSLEKYIANSASYNPQDMYVVNVIGNSCFHMGSQIISELVLSKIFNSIIPELESHLLPIPKPSTVAALMETILLLNSILPTLSPETVQKDYLQPSKIAGCSLPKLLLSFPLSPPWSILDVHIPNIVRYADIDDYISSHRRYLLHLELCKLLVSSSTIVGADACTEYVLPYVDKFFRSFVSNFGMLPIESKTMLKAFELGAELFVPLAQLTGPEAFYTAVQNMNPRLEMWLVSVDSGIPARSPPLPGNIWPEIASESAVNDTGKKKGFISWISSKSKWVGALSSTPSQAPQTPAAGTTNQKTSLNSGVVGIKTPLIMSEEMSESDANILSGLKQALHNLHTPAHGSTPMHSYQSNASHRTSIKHGFASNNRDTRSKTTSLPLSPGVGISPYAEGMELKAIEQSMMKQTESIPVATPIPKKIRAVSDSELDLTQNDHSRLSLYPVAQSLDEQFGENYGESSFSNLDPMDIRIEEARLAGSNQPSGAKSAADDSCSANKLDSDDEEINDTVFEGTVIQSDPKHSTSVSPLAFPPLEPATGILDSIDDVTPKLDNADYEKANADKIAALPTTVIPKITSVMSTSKRPSVVEPYNSYKSLLSYRSIETREVQYLGSRAGKRNVKIGSTNSGLQTAEGESHEEATHREYVYSENSWLLAGRGRWNVDKDLKDKNAKEQNKIFRGFNNRGGGNDWNPAAQISLVSPRIAVDVVSDATTVLGLNMHTNTQWKIEDAFAPAAAVKCMAINPIESLLLTCSRSGVKIWSLTSFPLVQLSSYNNHNAVPFAADFMRNGLHAATCDGSIHIWDVETSKAMAYALSTYDRGIFTFMNVVPTKYGVISGVGACGDEQIMATAGHMITTYDVRSYCAKAMKTVAEWSIPQLPPQHGHFVNSTVEPLQLSCCASYDNYVYAGSVTGGMWIIDRRMGRVLYSWQALDGPIVKVIYTVCP